jgi:hypothetical protein
MAIPAGTVIAPRLADDLGRAATLKNGEFLRK